MRKQNNNFDDFLISKNEELKNNHIIEKQTMLIIIENYK